MIGAGGGGGGGYEAPQDDVEIQVFVRECETDGHSFMVRESALANIGARGQQQQQQHQPAYQQQAPPRGGGATSASRPLAPSAANQPSATPSATKKGEVPMYLRQRKAEMEAEKEEAVRIAEIQREQSKYPPGHRPVTEEERMATLTSLAERKKQLEGDLGRLPMRFDTQAVRNRQKQIEQELAEVEEATKKFSAKKQLFVPI